jgi:RNA polymerase sigma-70 factor (sigma-E family)
LQVILTLERRKEGVMPGGVSDQLDESFTAFVQESGIRHLRVAALLTGDWHMAEDLVQASLLKLYSAWPGIDQDGGNPDAYLRRIIVNTQRSWWRARWRQETPVAKPPESKVQGDGSDEHALAMSVRQALQELPRRQRAVLVLRYFEDLPEAEVASLLGCSLGTVKTHARRGLRALRARLGDRLPTADSGLPTRRPLNQVTT